MITYCLKGSFPRGCDICSKETRKYEIILTPEIVRERSFAQFGGQIFYIERDKKDTEKCRFICREHGIKFSQFLYKHFKGQKSWPLCKKGDSRLATIVYQELQNYFTKDEIVEEKNFPDCKNHYCLKYDFYIESHNLLVEADGEGHFLNKPQWGGEAGFKRELIMIR